MERMIRRWRRLGGGPPGRVKLAVCGGAGGGVVERSREVANARYGARALLGDDGEIAEFLTSGISEEARGRIGRLPEGKGLLGAVIQGHGPLRVNRIADDPRSAGFAPHHPPT